MPIAIPIVFQNEDLIVVDKPVGISVHNPEDETNLLLELQRQLGQKTSLFPVHRLDKETSGIQIFARNESSAAIHADAFQTRSVRKTYTGLLRGQMKTDEGVWRQAISDKAEGRVNPAGLAKNRVAADTGFRVVKKNKFFSWCEFDLGTGRQHQIRKHAALNAHAIVGDPRYGDKAYNRRMANLYGETRMFLHCSEIEIKDQTFCATMPIAFDRLDSY